MYSLVFEDFVGFQTMIKECDDEGALQDLARRKNETLEEIGEESCRYFVKRNP